MISCLPPESFCFALAELPGSSCRRAVAVVQSGERRFRGVIKAYPPGSRGLANELVYWMLASAEGIHMVPMMWVLHMERQRLVEIWPEDDWGDEPIHAVLLEDELHASVPPSDVGWVRTEALVNDLMRWDRLVDAIALHEWTAHAGRDHAAVGYIGEAEFTLTDGSAIFGGQNWTPETLGLLQYVSNKLLYLAFGGGMTEETARRIKHAARTHEKTFRDLQGYLGWVWWEFVDDKSMRAATRFLEQRAGPDWMERRFGRGRK